MKKFFVITVLSATGLIQLCAHDFVIANIDGKDIYYKILSETECEVTNNNNGYTSYSGKIIIPENVFYGNKEYKVTRIGEHAFIGCWDWEEENLLDVKIPNTVTTIGEYAFGECYYMRSLTLPESIVSIEDRAFQACMSCESINIPKSVKSIGNNAFEDCTQLRHITIPSGLEHLGDQAFFRCGTSEINVEEGNLSYTSVDGVLYNKEKTKLIQFPCFRGGDFAVPEGVIEIVDYAFAFCSDLTPVTLPGTLTTIGSHAFEGAFNWSKECVLTIPNSVTSIGDHAFAYTNGLKTVVLPTTITEIAEGLFECTSITNIIIPDNITTIANSAFYESQNLSTIVLPRYLKQIGYAFQNCYVLEHIYCLAENIPEINKDAFQKYYNSGEPIVLHVLTGLKESFETLEPWNKFNVVEDLLTGDANNDGVVNNDDIQAISQYILTGIMEEMWNPANANLSKDGKIDVGDIISLKKIIETINKNQILTINIPIITSLSK